MKQTKSCRCLTLTDIDCKGVEQVIIVLKEEMLDKCDEAVEFSRLIVDNCMKKYNKKKTFKVKNVVIPLICTMVGLIVGFLC